MFGDVACARLDFLFDFDPGEVREKSVQVVELLSGRERGWGEGGNDIAEAPFVTPGEDPDAGAIKLCPRLASADRFHSITTCVIGGYL